MDGPPTYSSPLSALRVSLERLIAFISARRAPAVDEARPRYWSLPLQRAVCAVPLLPTPLDASSLFLSPGAPLSPIFVNLDHVRVFAYSGFLTGFMVGAYSGGRLRRLQFLAENSHRLPRTKAGWYFYLRERNYQVLKRAGQVGARNGLKWAGVVGGFALVETIVDIFRASMTPVEVKGGVEAELQATGLDGSLVPPGLLKFVGPGADPEDFKSTIIAGLATQIAFSKYYSVRLSGRSLAFGLVASTLIGVLQDFYKYTNNESSKYTYFEIIAPEEKEDPIKAAKKKAEEQEKAQKGKKEGGSWRWPWEPKEVGAVGTER